MKKILITSVLLSFFSFSTDIVGKWYDSLNANDYRTIFDIKRDDNGKYTVEILELRDPVYLDGEYKGQEIMDLYNKDKNLKTRKIVGIKIVEELYYNKENNYYEGGTIYNPEDGKYYYVYMWIEDGGLLAVKGYIDPMGWFGKTTKWSRVEK